MNLGFCSPAKFDSAGKTITKALVVTGTSGGHIFPAQAFLTAIKDKQPDIDVLLLLPQKSIIKKNERFTYKVKYIKLSSINRRLDFKNVRNILNFISGSLESLSILLKFQPDIVVGFGSLASLPAVTFAWLLRIKVLIHEQNVIPGRANRFLAGFADKIAVSFKETIAYLPGYERKTVVTGNPLRKTVVCLDKIEALNFFGFRQDRFTILVMGGSQGSRRINKEFLEAVSLLADKSLIQIIHLTGAMDYELLSTQYKDLNIKFALFSFFDSMEYAFNACDLVVSRAGATVISEMIFFRLPAILVPYPYAYRHQYKNAKVLEEKGCAIIIEDSEFYAEKIKEKVEYFLNNRKKLVEMRFNYNVFPIVNAADLLANEAMALN